MGLTIVSLRHAVSVTIQMVVTGKGFGISLPSFGGSGKADLSGAADVK